jgi:carbon monoxide dehydrogenase subunit G
MEVNIDKQYPVAAGLDCAWEVLSDIIALATCMPGAQITEQVDATHYKGSVKVKVGPAVAAFAGDIELLAIDPATRTLTLLGKGADKSGSSASMRLEASLVAAEDGSGSATLVGKAAVIINGKFAQFGGRMMASVSDVILAQFAATFSQKAQALQEAADAEKLATAAPQAATDGSTATAPTSTPMASPAKPVAAISAPKELNALALVWMMLRNFLAGLFGRKA